MGLSIGQTPGSSIPLRNTGARRPDLAIEGGDPPRDFISAGNDQAENVFKRETKVPTPGAGFGRDTISAPAAAVVTLTRGVEAVKDTLPSVEESRERLRQAARERQDQLDDRVRDTAEDRRIEVKIPDASAQARNFIRSLDETAARVDARLEGREPEAATRVAFEVNGETFPVVDRSRPGQRINFTA